MRENFLGLPWGIATPSPRVVTLRGRNFPRFFNSTFSVAQGFVHILGVPPLRGFTEIVAAGLATNAAAAGTATLALIARIGTVTVCQATLVTDQLDQDAATQRTIAANTPVLFRCYVWPSAISMRYGGIGITDGGLVTNFVTAANALLSPTNNEVVTSSAAVGEGNLEIGLQAGTNTSGVFTLDFLRLIEYPALEEGWT